MALIALRVKNHTYSLICRGCQWVLTDAICACNALHGFLYGDFADFPGHVCKPVAPPAVSPLTDHSTFRDSGEGGVLRETALWPVVQYPTDYRTTTAPPAALWEAVVDVVHLDTDGTLHGNELTRAEADSWLRYEAGIPEPVQEDQ